VCGCGWTSQRGRNDERSATRPGAEHVGHIPRHSRDYAPDQQWNNRAGSLTAVARLFPNLNSAELSQALQDATAAAEKLITRPKH